MRRRAAPRSPRRPARGRGREQCLLARLELLAESRKLVPGQQVPGAREHLFFFLVGMVLDQFLQHFRAAAEFLARGIGSDEIRQDEIARGTMLLERLEVHLVVVALLARLPERGIEDLFLDRRVRFQLRFDLRDELPAFLDSARRRRLELGEERTHFLVVGLQKLDGIHRGAPWG